MNQHVSDFDGVATTADLGPTFIYFLRADRFVKIGHSRQWKRRRTHMQIGSPHTIVPILVLVGDEGMERNLHNRFRADHYRGEWFHMSQTISEFVKGRLKDCVVKSGKSDLRQPRRTSWDDR